MVSILLRKISTIKTHLKIPFTPYSLLPKLHPLFDAEIEENEHDGEDHQADGEWIAVCP